MISYDRSMYRVPISCVPAVAWAKLYYRQHSKVDFDEDLQHYLVNGFVCSRPSLFAMAKVIIRDNEPAWYIHMAVGDVLELASVLPFYLSKIVFCRDNEKDKVRVYRMDRAIALAKKMGIIDRWWLNEEKKDEQS